MLSRWRAVAALAVAALVAGPAHAVDLYIDLGIGVASCADYDPATRACGAGTATAFDSLSAVRAPGATAPGDVVHLRAGVYTETLEPGASGTPGQPITYTAVPGESAVISGGLDPGIHLIARSHVVIAGLTVRDVTAWLRAEDCRDLVIRDCTFERATASGSRAGVKLVRTDRSVVRDNLIDDGNDNLQLIHSDRNLAVGNRVTLARHNLWHILCGNYNVIRGNYFHNSIQKAGQITDCEGAPSDATPSYDDTRRNLVEWNEFAFTASSGDASPYAGIQYSAQHGIVRRNTFHDTIGPALDLTLYSDEARFNYGNRIYHNVFHGSQFAGISLAAGGAGATFDDNRFLNNVAAGSVFVANDTRWSWYTDVLAGEPVQVLTGRDVGFHFARNLLWGGAPDELYTVTQGVRTSTMNPPPRTLGDWQSSRPDLFTGNLDLAPELVDPAGLDFHPLPTSPLVDGGTHLTSAVASGAGTSLQVADATYFYDGFGIPGEVGDRIQLDGSTTTARIVAIDEATDTLTLDAALTWSAGQGVHVAYSGTAPDIGVYEVGCSPLPEIAHGLRAVATSGDVALTWDRALDTATASFTAWKVIGGDAARIPTANQRDPGPDVVAACLAVAESAPVCIDTGAVTAAPPLAYYQVRGACADGTEGVAHPF